MAPALTSPSITTLGYPTCYPAVQWFHVKDLYPSFDTIAYAYEFYATCNELGRMLVYQASLTVYALLFRSCW